MAEHVRKEQGFVNLLFANAGVSGPRVRDHVPKLAKGETPTIQELQEGLFAQDQKEFTETFNVNTTAVVSIPIGRLFALHGDHADPFAYCC